MKGQATLEYLMIFSFMVMMSIALVKSLQATVGGTVGSLGYELTNHLSVGVCREWCFSDKFANKPQ